MAAYLHTLQTYKVVTATQRDEVDTFGQLLTFGGETTYKVRTPDAFVIDVVEDNQARQYIYDGNSVIVFAPRIGFYAKFAAPSTIRRPWTSRRPSMTSPCRSTICSPGIGANRTTRI